MIHLLWASLAIPVIIHLVYRQKAKRLPFSTLYFLRMVDQRVARRHRFKELLLLVARLLLLAALVGALERPMIRSSTFQGAGVPTTSVIVLDNTYSMRAAHQGSSAFARAKRAALGVLDALEKEDSAALVLFDSKDDAPPVPTTDLAGLRSRIEKVECGYGRAGLSAPLRRARQSIERSTELRKEIYIVTDMQAQCWTEGLGELVPENVPVFVVDVGAEIGRNLTLRAVDLGLKLSVAGAPTHFYCTVVNHSRRSLDGKLWFYLEGEKLAERSVAVAAGSQVVEAFTHVFDRTGTFSGYVELSPDELAADNRRYFSVRVHEKIRVLVVNGGPSDIPYRDEVFYLRTALEASSVGGSGSSPIKAEVILPDALLDRELES